MRYHVLGVGYFPSEYDMERTEWEHYGISFDFADSITQAAEKLHRQEYICIAIRSSQITHSELSILREVRDLPAIMLPPAYTAAERYVCAHFSSMQYIRASGQHETTEYNEDNCLQYYLSIPVS